jgi:PPOX class probable F420-dependent enzyme
VQPADLPHVWLTTLRADGSPHTTPVWFVLQDETVWIATSLRNVKVRNLARDPRVSMAFDQTASTPWVAEGRAAAHEHLEDHPDLLAAFAEKYDGWDAADSRQDGPRVLLEVSIGRWLLRS